jgi:multicomponent Na+:H+ antiporter subunit B
LGSGIIALFYGLPFMTGLWMALHSPWLEELKVGTPLLFDAGVYLVVLGVTLTIILSLAEE